MIVTIARDYSTAAHEVAHELGDMLGYAITGEDFAKVVGGRIRTAEKDVEAVESRTSTLVEWILGRLLGPVGSVSSSQTFEELIRREIEDVVVEAAARGNVIILGGVSNAILRDRNDTLTVFLHAPLPYRIGRVQASAGLSTDEARDEIQRMDGAKRRWAKIHYNLEWGMAAYYDLAIDVAHLGITGTARLIASTVRELEAAAPASG